MPLRCGRLDRHEPHEWPGRYPGPLTVYRCNGRTITEGAAREHDAADDAAEERAIRERREVES